MRMPNGDTIVATHTALLPFPKTPLAARKCDVFPAIRQPLLSLGQFCDAGFTATLNSETVLLNKDGSTTLSGTRDHNNGLCFIPFQGYPTSTPLTPTYNILTRNFRTNQCIPHSPPSLHIRQQCVSHEHTVRPGTVPAQCLLQPGCRYLVQGHRRRVFRHLARPHIQASVQAPPPVH